MDRRVVYLFVFAMLLDVVEAEREDFDDDLKENMFPIMIRSFPIIIRSGL